LSPSSRALALRFYDRDGDKIGKVDDLFVDENDQLEYVAV
jgi:sporulation protein YlmC with PRC-barrel domain